jgi:hypothetical protein
MLLNIHKPPAGGNFCDKREKALEKISAIVEAYGQVVGCVDKGDRMANDCSAN